MDILIQTLGLVLLTSPFWASALSKACDLESATAEIRALGLPFARATALGTITLQGLGSVLIILGHWVWPATLGLIGFTIAASCLAHDFWRQTGEARSKSLNAFTANMGLVGGLILAAHAAT